MQPADDRRADARSEPGPAAAGETLAPPTVPAEDIAHPPDLPAIGKWMLDPDGTPAHWLGELFEGKRLREPINVLIVDAAAPSESEAAARLFAATAAAGFPWRWGHSSGYRAFVGGRVFGQIPEGREHAFSDRIFELTNDHGRIFGPCAFDGRHLFVGAFSRERVNPLDHPGHRYVSFNQARDRFCHGLDARTRFKVRRFVGLDNGLIGDAGVTTGDHDGIAVLVEARE